MTAGELIEIVDSNDRPIGKATIMQALAQGLLHRVSRVMIEDSHSRVLLAKRASTKEVFPNRWGNSAAGHVDAGESYKAAAKRELAEELGIKKADLRELGYFYADTSYGKYKMKRFVKAYKTVIDKTPKNLQKREVSEVFWFTVPEVKEMIRKNPDQVEDGLVQIFERFY